MGLPPGESIPWGGWIGPLIPWAVIFASVYTIMITMTAMMRKQWVENERLIFPLMEVPMALLEDRDKGRIIPPVMRNRMFWIGVAIPVFVFGTHLLNGFNPNFPALRVFGQQIIIIRVTETWRELNINLIPCIVAFAYFAKLDVLFSLWFFALFAYIELNLFKMVGYTAGPMIYYEHMHHPALAWQGLGGVVVFALVGLFMARRHLKGVVRKIIFNAPDVDDSGEPMSYRSAGILFVLAVATLIVFLSKMGMRPPVAASLIFFLLISYLAITRVVIEGGLVLFTIPVNPVGAVIGLFGAKAMGTACLGAVAACAPFINNFKQIVMPTIANSMKLVEGEKLRRGTVVKACAWALAIGSIFCLWFFLVSCYDFGANGSKGFTLSKAGDRYFRSLVHTIKNVADPDTSRMMWGGVGAAGMGLLTIARYNFAWWPLHPIGYPFGFSGGVQTAMFSLFVAWAAKSIILRIGGVPLYLKMKPFFIGILIGHIIMAAAQFAVNMLMGPPGNPANFIFNFG